MPEIIVLFIVAIILLSVVMLFVTIVCGIRRRAKRDRLLIDDLEDRRRGRPDLRS